MCESVVCVCVWICILLYSSAIAKTAFVRCYYMCSINIYTFFSVLAALSFLLAVVCVCVKVKD
jgi:hypothetical protein